MSGRTPPNQFKRILDRRSTLRWSAPLPAMIRENRFCDLPVKLADISLSGCRVVAGYRLKTGTVTMIRITGFEPFAATIVWSNRSEAGLLFDKHLHPAVVAHLVRHSASEESCLDADASVIRPGRVS